MTVKDGAWTEWWDGQRKRVSMRFRDAKPWPALTRAITAFPRNSDDGGGGFAGNHIQWLQGIYQLEGDTLTLALVNEDTPLPDSFAAKENVSIEVWRRERIGDPSRPVPIDLKPFAGDWTLVYTNQVPVPDYFDPKERRLSVKDGVWSERWDGQFKPIKAEFKRTSLWPMIERKIKLDDEPPAAGGDSFSSHNNLTWEQKGIYRFEGDTLVFALAGSGTPLPVTFEPKEGVVIEVWRRDTKP